VLSAQHVVDRLLETGEPDQDYDHDMWDAVVTGLEKAGIPGARHREFDKYQGVYLNVPPVGKFWAKDVHHITSATRYLELVPPDSNGDESVEIPIQKGFQGAPSTADVDNLVAYCTKVISAKRLAHSMRNFVDTELEKPAKRSVKPKPKADLGSPNYGGGMSAGVPNQSLNN